MKMASNELSTLILHAPLVNLLHDLCLLQTICIISDSKNIELVFDAIKDRIFEDIINRIFPYN